MMDTIRIEKQNTRMVAHRGVSGLEKENTMAAFVAAGNRSYWGVETDVHRTADGQMVVIHDSDVKRVAGLELPVEGSDLATLREVVLLDRENRPGRADLRIPTLREYIRACKQYGKFCVPELKTHFTAEEIAQIAGEFRDEDYLDHAVFISFCTQNLIYMRELFPEQPVQQLTNRLDEEVLALLLEHRFDLDVDYRVLTEDRARRLHDAGVRINCWTVDDPAVAERLVGWGVEYLTSNILE